MRLLVYLFIFFILVSVIGCVSVSYLPDNEESKLSDELRFLRDSGSGFYYTVVPGDTLQDIARRFQVSLEMLETKNQEILKGSSLLKSGMRLFIPTRQIWEPKPQPKDEVEEKWIWPVNGTPISSGNTYDVNIRASYGQEVRAVKSGQITFTSQRLLGYGQVIIINHLDGFTSFYGYLSEILVKQGDWVKQGQVIGRVGNTGRATEPQLHFRLIKDNNLLDPLAYLP